ncbi:MAG TPA: hypothetical protein VGP12_03295, partial [Nitrosospira sp.]|nr:hypothetical protein [Nitrosospira sp.]
VPENAYLRALPCTRVVFDLTQGLRGIHSGNLALKNSLNTPDLPVGQSDLYPVRMVGGVGQKVFDGADGFAARSLVLF